MSTKLDTESTKFIPADKFTGKRVVDREGTNFGKVKHIHINSQTLAVSGVTIHQGFHKDYFLPDTYIDKFTDETLLLSTPPIRTSVPVVDIDGHKIGKIKCLNKNVETGDLESMTVSCGLRGSKVVSRSDVWGIGNDIILKVTKDELYKRG